MTSDQGRDPPDPGSTPLTDAELVTALGDPRESFALLFDRHHRAVHGYLARRAGASVADDLASETFLVALGAPQRYDTSHPDARPWLLGIATNLLRSHRRRESRHRSAQAGRVETSPDHADSVTDRLAARADLVRLSERIARLRTADRDTLMLYAVGELTYAQVGLALGVPTGTVRSRLNRCRRLLGALPAPRPTPLAPLTGQEVCHD